MKSTLQSVWKRTCTVFRAIKKDIQTIFAVAEVFSYVGLLTYASMAVYLTLKNEPVQLNGYGLVGLLAALIGVAASLFYGYWEHLIKEDTELKK